jgi:fumarate hydratase class II
VELFDIGGDLIARQMVPACAITKKAAALVNRKAGPLGDIQRNLIAREDAIRSSR